jgi:hypothetical protein
MAESRPTQDRVTARVERLFRERYAAGHPRASVMAYRPDGWSIRVRVIDPDFELPERTDRLAELFEPIISELPFAVQERIGLVLPLTPEEASDSPTSAEFDAAAGVLAKKPAARNGRATPGRR